jgi:hypothetical protein
MYQVSSMAWGKHSEVYFGKLVAAGSYANFSSYGNILINDNEIFFKQNICSERQTYRSISNKNISEIKIVRDVSNLKAPSIVYSVALVRERTIPTERRPLIGEGSAIFFVLFADRVCRSAKGIPQPYFRFSRPEQILSLPSSSSVVLTRLSGPRSRATTSQKIW